MGDADGRVWEVFNPPWWRLDRWFLWLSERRRPKGRITIGNARGDTFELRVWLSKVKLARVMCVDEAKQPDPTISRL